MTPGLFIGFTAPGFAEGLFILVVILLLFGVKDAPRMARKVADFFQQLRFTANEFRNEFMYSDMRAEADARAENPEEVLNQEESDLTEENQTDDAKDVE
jgi:Sec-independent protein translocase protein TatA